MLKKKHYILPLLAIIISLSACNNQQKVYDSSKGVTSNKKKSTLAVGKFNKLLKGRDSQLKFDAAQNYYSKKDYQRAIILLENILPIYKGTSKEEEAKYLYARSFLGNEDYLSAGYQFSSFVKKFPHSKHRESALYNKAICSFNNSPVYSLDQKETYIALEDLQNFINQYPKSENVASCNSLLDELRAKLDRKSYDAAMLFYNMTEYKAALVAFKNHIETYPDSKKKEELEFLTVKASYLLAKNSIESKKDERFDNTVKSYTKFVKDYPESEYLNEAENIHKSALKKK